VYPRDQPPALRPWLRDNALRLPLLASDYLEAPAGSGSWEDIAIRDSAIAHAQVASHMLVVAPPESSSTSVPCRVSIPPDARQGTNPAGAGGQDAGRGEQRGSETGGEGARAASTCGLVSGWHVQKGDRCNMAFLQACHSILHGVGAVDRLHWFTCAAQALACIASSMAEPPPLIWKNAAAALEQLQLVLGDDAALERSKLSALSRYAAAEICDAARLSVAASRNSSLSVASAAAARVASGGEELASIVAMLAAGDLPVPCLAR